MDTTMFEFTTIEDMLFDAFNTSKEYLEFCSDLDELGQLSAYDEGMTYDDTKTSLKNDIFKIGKNTWDTTKDVGRIYKYATDSKAKTYKGLWDLFVRLLQLITKVIAFIWNMLGKIPVYLLRLIDWITHLPTRIVNKIKGNIELYITVDDIKNIYSVDLFENIGIILKNAKLMMNGEFWTKWKKRIYLDKKDINIHKEIDIPGMDKNIKIDKRIEIPVLAKDPGTKKAIQEIIKIYESKLSKIRFVKSIVDLGREDNVNLYFKTKEITVTNRYMKSRTGSYLDLINGLITDMKDKQTELQDVSKSVSDNLQAASTEDGFLSLSASDRAAIYRSTQCLSGTINILGNIVKYAQKDIQTIDNARKRIMNKTDKKVNIKSIDKVRIDELHMSDLMKWFNEKLTASNYKGIIYMPKDEEHLINQYVYDTNIEKIIYIRDISYSSMDQELENALNANKGKIIIDPSLSNSNTINSNNSDTNNTTNSNNTNTTNDANSNIINSNNSNDAWKELKQNKKKLANNIADRHNQAAKEIEKALKNIYSD